MNARSNESDVSVAFRLRCRVTNVLTTGVSVLFNVLMPQAKFRFVVCRLALKQLLTSPGKTLVTFRLSTRRKNSNRLSI